MNDLNSRAALIGVLLLIGPVVSSAETIPSKGAVDARIRSTSYREDEVYRLYGFVGYAIELVFEDGEVFAGNGGGDLDGISFGWHDNHLLLKPKASNVGTNLVVYTNRRAYRFEYSVSTRRPNRQTDEVIYTVRFEYPPPPRGTNGLTAAEQAEFDLKHSAESRVQNIDYWYCGAPAIKPIVASDDGVHTRLRFPAKAELPAIFVRNDDDTESLLNFSMEDGDVIIHRVAPRFVLRRGKLTGCIVNKGFGGSGDRLESGTVAPAVRRQRKDGAS